MTEQKTAVELKSDLTEVEVALHPVVMQMVEMYDTIEGIISDEIQDAIDKVKPALFVMGSTKEAMGARVLWDMSMQALEQYRDATHYHKHYACTIASEFEADTEANPEVDNALERLIKALADKANQEDAGDGTVSSDAPKENK